MRTIDSDIYDLVIVDEHGFEHYWYIQDNKLVYDGWSKNIKD